MRSSGKLLLDEKPPRCQRREMKRGDNKKNGCHHLERNVGEMFFFRLPEESNGHFSGDRVSRGHRPREADGAAVAL
ncbi:hypothetical protein JTE90_015398 [Oedothorax gibbosus]|uniref:Uncharacterized protein n=1 Tax=Oedothorax gibbosus TaxID=931172 RepID=A0AAV6TCU0_9ARAC|nr:hypothetical protein JTE90_015398 [Oedothorax gibbosus]